MSESFYKIEYTIVYSCATQLKESSPQGCVAKMLSKSLISLQQLYVKRQQTTKTIVIFLIFILLTFYSNISSPANFAISLLCPAFSKSISTFISSSSGSNFDITPCPNFL